MLLSLEVITSKYPTLRHTTVYLYNHTFCFLIFTLDYQALWLMQRVIGELNEVCLKHATVIPYHQPLLTPVWWSSFVLKNTRRQMEDYITVVPYFHTLFDVKVCIMIHNTKFYKV